MAENINNEMYYIHEIFILIYELYITHLLTANKVPKILLLIDQ